MNQPFSNWMMIAGLILAAFPTATGCRTFHSAADLSPIAHGIDASMQTTSNDRQAVTTGEKVELLIESAAAAEDREDFETAFAQYDKALSFDPGHATATRRLAALYAKRGDAAKSSQLFVALIAAQPRDAELLCDYAYALYLTDRFDNAESQLNLALEINPELIRARNLHGMIYARSGEIELAKQQFASTGIRKAEIHANIALAQLLSGDAVGAEKSIEAAKAFGPNHELSIKLSDYQAALKQL